MRICLPLAPGAWTAPLCPWRAAAAGTASPGSACHHPARPGGRSSFGTRVYEKFTGPDSFPKAAPTWRGIELHGTAQTVIVPL